MSIAKVLPGLILTLTCLLLASPSISFADDEKLLIDAVVASVDGKPITLQDVLNRMRTPRVLSLSEASADPEARQILEILVQEQLVLLEAESRHISVGPAEVDTYLDEVARRNDLTREGFELALAQEGKTVADYKDQVKLDILKSKLASNVMQAGAAVSLEEIETYIAEHPELQGGNSKIKVSRIYISHNDKGSKEFENQVTEVKAELEAGTKFEDIARRYSDGPEARAGGSLGVLAIEDLSREIFEKVFSLSEGEVSSEVVTDEATSFYRVDERLEEDSEDRNEKIQAEVRKTLQSQKLETRMQTFFSVELFKLHSVDKKI